jgi:hypothetical protein
VIVKVFVDVRPFESVHTTCMFETPVIVGVPEKMGAA